MWLVGVRVNHIIYFSIVFLELIYETNSHSKIWKRQTRATCKRSQFQCKTMECVDQFVVCDGAFDCEDGSDETLQLCESISCPSFAFRCRYGACVDASAKCDGMKNCADNSDESGCLNLSESKINNCKKGQFNCKSGSCIDPFLLCDGNIDCEDGSDETSEECGSFSCPSYSFRCDYGACIPEEYLCNEVKECADGSDESRDKCGSSSFPQRPVFNANLSQTSLKPSTHEKSTNTPSLPKPLPSSSSPFSPSFSPPFSTSSSRPASSSFVSTTNNGKLLFSPDILKPNLSTSPTSLSATTTSLPPRGGCILPSQPKNGLYRLGGCYPPSCEPVPGTRVQTTFITYLCDPGFNLTGFPVIACEGDTWTFPIPKCSRVTCPPLINPSRIIECKLNEKKYNCSEPLKPGTRASVECGTFYEHSPGLANFDVNCQNDGKWSRDVTSCIPSCGDANPNGIPFIANAKRAKLGEFPWHAAIYKRVYGKMSLTCGGNIVSERAIVTTAHCFWDDIELKMVKYQDYKVLVGKYFLDWATTTRHVQYPEIDRVFLHERYRGLSLKYEYDVAVILLKEDLLITQAVRPICIDYGKKYTNYFSPGKTGIVVGWGITETMSQSPELRTATLPIVDYEVCAEDVPSSFKPYIIFDKFCAGYTNKTSVCPGDSGGGFAMQFPRGGKWFLMGLVSVGVPPDNADMCNAMYYTTFTKVFEYYDFIRNFSATRDI